MTLLRDEELFEASRFMLEQSFPSDDGKFETHRTAAISVIGSEPCKGLERRLVALNFPTGRFRSFLRPGDSGRWMSKRTRKVPDFSVGLIFVERENSASLPELQSEALRYAEAGSLPLIALPSSRRFEIAIKRQLADCGFQWRFVRHHNWPPSKKRNHTFKIAHLNALLCGALYPGLVCTDVADLNSVILEGDNVAIQQVVARSFDALQKRVDTNKTLTAGSRAVFLTVWGPQTLSLNEVHEMGSAVLDHLPSNCTKIVAGLADSQCSTYRMYVVTNG